MGHRVHTCVRMYAIWGLLSKNHKQRLCPASSDGEAVNKCYHLTIVGHPGVPPAWRRRAVNRFQMRSPLGIRDRSERRYPHCTRTPGVWRCQRSRISDSAARQVCYWPRRRMEPWQAHSEGRVRLPTHSVRTRGSTCRYRLRPLKHSARLTPAT